MEWLYPLPSSTHVPRKGHVSIQRETGHLKQGGRALPDTNRTGSVTMDFPNSRTMRKYMSLCKPFSLWYFVMTNQADQYKW